MPIRVGSKALIKFAYALSLLIWSVNLKDPHLFVYRAYETPTLLFLSFSGILGAYKLKDGSARKLLLTCLAGTAALTIFGEVSFLYRKHLVLNEKRNSTGFLGEHFIVGYTNPDPLKPLIINGLISGIFVTQNNALGKSAGALQTEISRLQNLRKAAGLPPLIIATDQEGGIVSRLSPPLAKKPPLAEIVAGDRSSLETELKAEAYGEEQGRELAALGVTVNFSPVVDMKMEQEANPLNFHTLISRRAISSDPEITTRVALAYSRGLEQNGVTPTLKHFPGLGRVSDDTHHFSAALSTSKDVLSGQDWIPFRKVAQQTHALIMIGHVVLPEIDPESPASFSKRVIQDILREEWRHDGILITDDMTMRAAYGKGLCNATVKALNAGVDILLISYDHEKYYDAMYCAARAYEDGRLDIPMLNQSHSRLAQRFSRPH
jgi:beta-N-acetylhexosaminidase